MSTHLRLRRRLTAFNTWSLAFGGVIGWGSFVMPGTVFLKRAGTLGTLIAMELAAFIMLIISYSYAYMIHKFPVTGGQFFYADKAFGSRHGFICAWFLGLCYISIIPMNATALCLIFRALCGDLLKFGFYYKLAGYDIYFGEILLACVALILFAYISSLKVYYSGRLQSIFVILLLAGVLVTLAGLITSPNTNKSDLLPMFYPDDSRNYLTQIISVLVVAPWAFVGFDIVPLLSEESRFSRNYTKSIMDIAILCGCFVYIVLNVIAASGFSEKFSGWVEYVNALPNLNGIEGIATFSAAHKVLGRTGIFFMSLAAFMAMLTGITAFYTATSRLLYSMSREKMLPSWFGKLNRNNIPLNAVIFCMAVSILAPFAGRNALGWTVDMSSIGGAVSMAYTSLAAIHFARSEEKKRIDMIIFGGAGFIFSVIFALLLLVPVGFDCSLEMPSYVLLIMWTILGVIFYKRKNFIADK